MLKVHDSSRWIVHITHNMKCASSFFFFFFFFVKCASWSQSWHNFHSWFERKVSLGRACIFFGTSELRNFGTLTKVQLFDLAWWSQRLTMSQRLAHLRIEIGWVLCLMVWWINKRTPSSKLQFKGIFMAYREPVPQNMQSMAVRHERVKKRGNRLRFWVFVAVCVCRLTAAGSLDRGDVCARRSIRHHVSSLSDGCSGPEIASLPLQQRNVYHPRQDLGRLPDGQREHVRLLRLKNRTFVMYS